MCPWNHKGVEGDRPEVVAHLPHPVRLDLDTVDGENPTRSDVGDPKAVEAHRPQRIVQHQVVKRLDVRKLDGGEKVLAGIARW